MGRSPVLMQIAHWAIAVTAVTVFVCKAPFSTKERAAAVSGYFFLYEYAAISRNYGLGTLWLWIYRA